jgi:hypothetical protein
MQSKIKLLFLFIQVITHSIFEKWNIEVMTKDKI